MLKSPITAHAETTLSKVLVVNLKHYGSVKTLLCILSIITQRQWFNQWFEMELPVFSTIELV